MADTQPRSILLSLRLTQAMALARRGQWREAEAAVAEGRQLPDDPIELHALAALVTSEGNYLRALKLWEQLLEKDPTHAEAKRMIAAIDLWLSRPSWARYFPLILGLAGALVVALFLWLALGSSSPTVSPNHPAAAVSPVNDASPQAVPTPVPVTEPAPVVSFPPAKPARKRAGH